MNVLNRIRKFASKEYRDGYMQTHVRGGIAYQIRALREKFDMSQSEFACEISKPQSVVCRLEDVEYGRVSVQTLLDIASSLNVALMVRFVSYPEFLSRYSDMSTKALQPDTIDESLKNESQKILIHYQAIAMNYLGPIHCKNCGTVADTSKPFCHCNEDDDSGRKPDFVPFIKEPYDFIVNLRDRIANLEAALRLVREALDKSNVFIQNGVQLGFIRMPDDDVPDPAHETLFMIEAALSEIDEVLK